MEPVALEPVLALYYLFAEVLGIGIDRPLFVSLGDATQAVLEAYHGGSDGTDIERFGDEVATALTHIRRLDQVGAPAFTSTEEAISWGEQVGRDATIDAQAVQAWYTTLLTVVLADPSPQLDANGIGPALAGVRQHLDGRPIAHLALVRSFLAEWRILAEAAGCGED